MKIGSTQHLLLELNSLAPRLPLLAEGSDVVVVENGLAPHNAPDQRVHQLTPDLRIEENIEHVGDPLGDEAPRPKKSRPDQWTEGVIGTTPVLVNSSMDRFKCPIQGCEYEHEHQRGIIAHVGRHRKQLPVQSIQSQDPQSPEQNVPDQGDSEML